MSALQFAARMASRRSKRGRADLEVILVRTLPFKDNSVRPGSERRGESARPIPGTNRNVRAAAISMITG